MLTLTFKKRLENALKFETNVVSEYFAMCSADFTCVDGPTMQEVSRESHLRELTGFRINFFKNDFSVHLEC